MTRFQSPPSVRSQEPVCYFVPCRREQQFRHSSSGIISPTQFRDVGNPQQGGIAMRASVRFVAAAVFLISHFACVRADV